MAKRITLIGLALSLAAGSCFAMPARAATIDEIKKQLAQTQQQLDAINGQASGIEGKKDAVEEEINELDGQLVELMSSISLLEDEIDAKKIQIDEATKDLEKATQDEHNQYEAMKKRIKFMYERGNITYVQLLFEAKDMSDMMNRADYIEKLYEYDRERLIEYQETKEKVAELKERLEADKAELEAEEYELKEEQAALEVALDEKRKTAENYEAQLSKIKQDAAQYKALIKQQTDQIKQLEEEERKAREEAERKAREQANKNNSSNNNSNNSSSKPAGTPASADIIGMINSASGSSKGKEIAQYACRFIGNPYVAGGTSLTDGADCSGFTQAVYRSFGITIPRNSSSQRSYGDGVSYSEAEPGDIICYAGHVGIYIGNGYIVHASTPQSGIKITQATYREILSVRRIV